MDWSFWIPALGVLVTLLGVLGLITYADSTTHHRPARPARRRPRSCGPAITTAPLKIRRP
jgi:hypothetical protein